MRKKTLDVWETAVVIVTIGLFTVANSFHVLTEWLKNKPGFIFNAITHSYPDYFLYMSHVAQGAAGTLIFTQHQFTNEPLSPTAFYWVYSLIGYGGHLIGLTPPWSYNIALLFLVISVLILWYMLSRVLYPSDRPLRLTTFFVILSASPFINMPLLLTRGTVEFPLYLWFSPAPAFNRLGGVPHQIVQIILLLLVLFIFDRLYAYKRYSLRYVGSLLLLMAASFIATQSQPAQMALLLIAAGITALIPTLKQRKLDIRPIIPVIAAGLVSIPAALSVSHEYTTPIYVIAKAWEGMQYSPTTPWWWAEVLGPIVILIPFGIWPFLKKAQPLRRIFFLFGLLSVICYNSPIPKLLGVVPQRFLHPASYALFPVLAVSGFFAVRQGVMRFVKPKRVARFIQGCFIVIAILTYIVFTIPADVTEIIMRVQDPMLVEASLLNHTPMAIVNGLLAVRHISVSTPNPVVLADGDLGIDLLIPMYTGHVSFLGQAIHTLYPDVKDALRQKFFIGDMTPAEARQFLIDHRIGFVIIPPAHQQILMKYPGLTKAFQNDAIAVYTVHL